MLLCRIEPKRVALSSELFDVLKLTVGESRRMMVIVHDDIISTATSFSPISNDVNSVGARPGTI